MIHQPINLKGENRDHFAIAISASRKAVLFQLGEGATGKQVRVALPIDCVDYIISDLNRVRELLYICEEIEYNI